MWIVRLGWGADGETGFRTGLTNSYFQFYTTFIVHFKFCSELVDL